MKELSLRKFAEQIGVSPGTVSKVFSPDGCYRITPEKRSFIRRMASELGFRPADKPEIPAASGKRIGIICGPSANLHGSFFFEGARAAAAELGVKAVPHVCENSIPAEMEALRLMLADNIDGIVYWPTMKIHPDSQKRLSGFLSKVAQNIPLLYIGGGALDENIVQLRYREQRIAEAAALRQLRLGCEYFAVLRYYRRWDADCRLSRIYCDTLKANGVNPRRIRTVTFFPHEFTPSAFAVLKNVRGMWVEQAYLALILAPVLARYVDLGALHLDAVEWLEVFQQVYFCAHPLCYTREPVFRLNRFASFNIPFYSLRTVARQALAAMSDRLTSPAAEYSPKIQYIEALSPEETAEEVRKNSFF